MVAGGWCSSSPYEPPSTNHGPHGASDRGERPDREEMKQMPSLVKRALGCLVAVFIPCSVFAQATLTGSVKDTSGAVLPGVTVEASSTALIEKTRSATTDGSGQFRIVDLRPGQYVVTFSLPGFN